MALEKEFWALPRGKQNTFLKTLYSVSPLTKDVFKVWLDEGEEKVLEDLIEKVKKQTSNKIGKSRKIKVTVLNDIIKNAKIYPLSKLGIIELYFAVWTHLLEFVCKGGWIPVRYQTACARYIEEYIAHLQDIPEVSERKEREEYARKHILDRIDSGYYLPEIGDMYVKLFCKEEDVRQDS